MKFMHRRFNTGRKMKGFTLVELGIVMALAGILLFYAVSKMGTTSDASKAQSTVQDLSEIVSGTKRTYSTQSSYAGATVTVLYNSGVFPKNWQSGGIATGPWGGAIAVASGGAVGATGGFITADDNLKLSVPNVPQGICAQLVQTMAGGIERITVAGTVVKQYQSTVDLSALGTQCMSSGSVTVDFTFGKM